MGYRRYTVPLTQTVRGCYAGRSSNCLSFSCDLIKKGISWHVIKKPLNKLLDLLDGLTENQMTIIINAFKKEDK